jgi:hypothetical protein
MCNVHIDTVNKEISSSSNWGGMQGSQYNLYRVVDNKLRLVEESLNDGRNSVTKKLINDSLIVSNQITSDKYKDENGEWVTVETHEELINGKLEIVQRLTIKYLKGKPTQKQRYNGMYLGGLYGSYLVIKDEEFHYKTDENNIPKIYVKIKTADFDEWITKDTVINYIDFKNGN